jgi:hypothetical protein
LRERSFSTGGLQSEDEIGEGPFPGTAEAFVFTAHDQAIVEMMKQDDIEPALQALRRRYPLLRRGAPPRCRRAGRPRARQAARPPRWQRGQ